MSALMHRYLTTLVEEIVHQIQTFGKILYLPGCELVNCEGPFTARELRENAAKLCCKPREVVRPYKKTYAWVLSDAKRVQPPVAYDHPRGAVIWVKLKEPVARQVIRRIADA